MATDAPSGKKSGSTKSPPSKPFVPKPIEPLLGREELRVCMAQQTSNKLRGEEVVRLQAEILAEKDELQRSAEAMKAEVATLDRSNEQTVDAFNARAKARSLKVAEFEKRVDDFNAKVLEYDAARAAYASECENRKFDENDEKALLKGS